MLASVLNPAHGAAPPQPPACTAPALPPVLTATPRPLPPFVPPLPPRLMLHAADGHRSLLSDVAPKAADTAPSERARRTIDSSVAAARAHRPADPVWPEWARKTAESTRSDHARKPPDPALRRVWAELLAHTPPEPTVSQPAAAHGMDTRRGSTSAPSPGATTPPALATTPAAAERASADQGAGSQERQQQMQQVAGSLDYVARLLRGRGLSALFRNEPDPLNQRLLGVIADHLAARESR